MKEVYLNNKLIDISKEDVDKFIVYLKDKTGITKIFDSNWLYVAVCYNINIFDWLKQNKGD